MCAGKPLAHMRVQTPGLRRPLAISRIPTKRWGTHNYLVFPGHASCVRTRLCVASCLFDESGQGRGGPWYSVVLTANESKRNHSWATALAGTPRQCRHRACSMCVVRPPPSSPTHPPTRFLSCSNTSWMHCPWGHHRRLTPPSSQPRWPWLWAVRLTSSHTVDTQCCRHMLTQSLLSP